MIEKHDRKKGKRKGDGMGQIGYYHVILLFLHFCDLLHLTLERDREHGVSGENDTWQRSSSTWIRDQGVYVDAAGRSFHTCEGWRPLESVL